MDRKRRVHAQSSGKGIVASVEKFLQFLGRPVFIISLGTCIALLLLVARILTFIKNSVLFILHSVIPDVIRNLYKNLHKFRHKAGMALRLPKFPQIKLPHIGLRKKLIGGLIFIFILLTSYSLFLILRDLPSPSDLRNHRPKLTTHILDRNGQELYKIYKDENRSLVMLNQLPEYVIDSTVAIEDKEFWNHVGFSLSGIIRALRHDLGDKSSLQGGSTITQQLVKNTLLSSEKTFTRKIRELVLATWIERTFTKKEILQMYLNEVSYGGTAYGIQEAAEQYFGKDAQHLTLAEAALLAGLPAAPTSYSPLGTHPERARERQAEVLRRMTEDGYLAKEEAQAAKDQELAFKDGATNIIAPHFVMYVRDILVDRYGEAMVNHGGLIVTTTLDVPTQEFAQRVVSEEVDKLGRLRVSNGAALVTDPKNGDILAMIGSKNYFDFKHDGQVNVTARPRQPGSSIKPVNYAAALQRGFTPASVILDAPITFQIPGSKPYAPVNYDGKFHGPVPLRTALGSSYNIPAVKVLSTIGVDAMIDQGEKMGIKTWGDRKRFGLSLTLGGGEITMMDMAEMYGTLANYGMHVPLDPILKIENSNGKILYQKTQNTQRTGEFDISDNLTFRKSDSSGSPSFPSIPNRALPAGVAYQLTSILSDPAARAPAFGTHSVLNVPVHQVAVKTGTTNNLRDNWTFGYTTDLVVAAWVGNNDNSPMSYIASGITGASPIWAIIMKGLLSTRDAPHVFPKPTDLVAVKICTLTGQLPCEGCPVKEEIFLSGTEPTQSCRPEVIQEIKTKQEENRQQRDQILQGASTQR